ncbi:hypothetical protein MUN82_10035 [Hymenobacter aerilatus]|uniref:Uncharacterized protein n=1 Tax=Hymenobacter aerilatus TaxID=2932251 RepID=A0A8T9SZA1_9BACT|nr:hypothetical protein [Hymenobacter aerilatus]UOR07418.1 hypothetical protein MUN82_10035 [Hymenobacter aerilatus]
MDYLPLPTTGTDDYICELYPPLSPTLCRELRLLLTPEETLAGCQVYEVEEPTLGPTLPRGSYAVVQPLPPSQWPTVQPGEHCFLTLEYLADAPTADFLANFMSNEFVRVVANQLRTAGTLAAIISKDNPPYPTVLTFETEERAGPDASNYLRGIGRVLRVILLPTV